MTKDEKEVREILKKKNVSTFGRDKNGVWRVGVTHHEPLSALAKKDVVPPRYKVDNVGVIRAQGIHGGASVGHVAISAGTLGCWVHNGEGQPLALSNNHVFADSNAAEIGDHILQPGPYDGGEDPVDWFASLFGFIRLHFIGEESTCTFSKAVEKTVNKTYDVGSKIPIGGIRPKTRFKAVVPEADLNTVDCAVAIPITDNYYSPEIEDIGVVKSPVFGEAGMAVKKMGRTTALTTGEIQQVDVTANVQYGAGKVAVFTDQLLAGAMSMGGDSGSAVVDDSNHITGLLFAGSDSVTIINRIQNVFDALKITL